MMEHMNNEENDAIESNEKLDERDGGESEVTTVESTTARLQQPSELAQVSASSTITNPDTTTRETGGDQRRADDSQRRVENDVYVDYSSLPLPQHSLDLNDDDDDDDCDDDDDDNNSMATNNNSRIMESLRRRVDNNTYYNNTLFVLGEEEERGKPSTEELERWGPTPLCRTGFPMKNRGKNKVDATEKYAKVLKEKIEEFKRKIATLSNVSSVPSITHPPSNSSSLPPPLSSSSSVSASASSTPTLSFPSLSSSTSPSTLNSTISLSSGQLGQVQDALIIRILSFLEMKDLCRIARVCKRLSTLSSDSSLWKELHLRYFGPFCILHFGTPIGDRFWREPLQGLAWKKACMHRTKSILAKKNIKLPSVTFQVDKDNYSHHASSKQLDETQKNSIIDIEELYIDIIESVHIVIYPNGKMGQCDVIGKVQARCYLSGIPYIELQFNPIDRAFPSVMANENHSPYDGEGVKLDDITFHACVDVESFMKNNLVCFVPPGNESFDLLRYRQVNVPREKLLVDMVCGYLKDLDTNTFTIELIVTSKMEEKSPPTKVVVVAPTPKSASKASIKVSSGKAKFKSTASAIVWKLPSVKGKKEFTFSAKVKFNPRDELNWNRPPVQLSCEVGNASISSFRVEKITVIDKSQEVLQDNDNILKWIRYLTHYKNFQHMI